MKHIKHSRPDSDFGYRQKTPQKRCCIFAQKKTSYSGRVERAGRRSPQRPPRQGQPRAHPPPRPAQQRLREPCVAPPHASHTLLSNNAPPQGFPRAIAWIARRRKGVLRGSGWRKGVLRGGGCRGGAAQSVQLPDPRSRLLPAWRLIVGVRG